MGTWWQTGILLARGSLLFLVLTAPGCFGSCGGCSGGGSGEKIIEGLSVLAENLPDVPLDLDEFEAGEGPEVPSVDLGEVDIDSVRGKFEGLGWKIVDCIEGDEEEEQKLLVMCSFAKQTEVVQVLVTELASDFLARQVVEEALYERQVAVLDGRRVLTVEVSAKKTARELLTSVMAGRLPASKKIRESLEDKGWEVHHCEKHVSADSAELNCTFARGPLAGELEMIELSRAEMMDFPVDWSDQVSEGVRKGRVEAVAVVSDREAARRLVVELYPEVAEAGAGLVILVEVDPVKSNGRSWDAVGGEPDPYIKVNGKSYRHSRCQDDFECRFQVPVESRLEIEVWDADAAKDDFAGRVTCTPGKVCEARNAQVEVRRRF